MKTRVFLYTVSVLFSLPLVAQDSGIVETKPFVVQNIVTPVVSNPSVSSHCGGILSFFKGILNIGSCIAGSTGKGIRELGLLSDTYIVKPSEEHPYITGAVTLGLIVLFLSSTKWGNDLCAGIMNFFCGPYDDDEQQSHEEEELTDHQKLVQTLRNLKKL